MVFHRLFYRILPVQNVRPFHHSPTERNNRNVFFGKLYGQQHTVGNNGQIAFADKKRYNMMLILIFMTVFLWMFSLYVLLYYMNSLINLLLISRCIFKIIPTKVINKTKELEDWIDDRY